MPATQALYRTQNQLGQPTATVATIIPPSAAGPPPTKLLSYQTFYDGLDDSCRPSYTLQGGVPATGSGNADNNLLLGYVRDGYTVVSSDYEGPTDDYTAGRESGYGTLDGIRAAENKLGLPATAPVGLVGYSGGAIASDWASELEPSYATELNIAASPRAESRWTMRTCLPTSTAARTGRVSSRRSSSVWSGRTGWIRPSTSTTPASRFSPR